MGSPPFSVARNCNSRLLSSPTAFFLAAFVLLGSIAGLYSRFVVMPKARVSTMGCREDNEGSWAVGVFYGDSPFSLRPIEDMNISSAKAAAWPVANPVFTCASASQSGFPSNFVADPFLYVKGDTLFLFFETKNAITMQGDIGVARSFDKGATWEQLGIVLDEDWHLSYPYVFDYNGNIYMMPEGSAKGDLRLYRAVDFPTEWTLERVILKRPMVDSFIIPHDGKYWLFGSDHSGIGVRKNGQLEIWYSASPLGPWRQHKKNPIYNKDKSMGARNGGRPFVFDGNIYRAGQDCGSTYGRRVRLFKIEVLTTHEFKETEVPLGIEESLKGRNAWNGARTHQLDVQQVGPGHWVAVMDGDHVPSGDLNRRLVLGWASVVAVAGLLVLLGMILGAVTCSMPLSLEKPNLLSSILDRVSSFLHTRLKPNIFLQTLVLSWTFLGAAVMICVGVTFIYGGNGAQEPYPLNGIYSQFTLLTMTNDARLWDLKMFIKHYSRCSSVREVVVQWNRGTPPLLTEFDSAVPVRIRVEEENSFKVDPSIKTRAILELDDDIMMTCDDVERGFKVWREHPDRIVEVYPRLVIGEVPLKNRTEKHARKDSRYRGSFRGRLPGF
ncbi:hypothetical protein DM860_017512 [Cuscuta australis]|uniref:Uncharacterized protein n=1 Tax=Cuscuta australis TaxID=267555 RepID=A0A328DDS7_9ASTE|nr:hypothetical protein DM860_017512 [Cuscuta australis]